MRLEREIEFRLQTRSEEEAQRLLASPLEALGRLQVFRDLSLEGNELSGALVAPFAILGEVRFPFRARFRSAGSDAWLEPLPPDDPASDLWAELEGQARRERADVAYRARIALHIHLPEGEKWGGKAFRKLAEAAFTRTLTRTLDLLGNPTQPTKS